MPEELLTRKPPKYRVILCNDGATLGAPDKEAPIGVAGFVDATFSAIRDTTINTLYWQLGTDPFKGTATHRLSDWYSHKTKIGPVWGEGRSRFKTAGEWRIYENARSLLEDGIDAPAVVVEYGHRAGLHVFLSLRINDGSDCRLADGPDDANLSPNRRDHPGWLLCGNAFIHPQVTRRQQDHIRFAYNFALPEVRAYTAALILEAIENYDLDGFDIDFCRQPGLFKANEAASGAGLITALLAQVRGALDVKSTRIGRRLLLSVRVPPDLEANLRSGLDVAKWISSGLVDIVILGDPRGWNYRLPVEQYLALAKGSNCQIVAQNLCAFREDRRQSEIVLFGAGTYYSPEQFRAIAALHWQAGAQGQFIWNQHFIKYAFDSGFDPGTWREIGDPAKLERLNKHYLVGHSGRGGNLPVKLKAAGDRVTLDVEIADRVTAFNPPKILLRVLLEQLTRLDAVEIRLGEAELIKSEAREWLNYNDCWLEFDVSSIIRQRNNALQIKIIDRNPFVEADLVLQKVEVLVFYENSPIG